VQNVGKQNVKMWKKMWGEKCGGQVLKYQFIEDRTDLK